MLVLNCDSSVVWVKRNILTLYFEFLDLRTFLKKVGSFRFRGNCLGLAFVACKSRGYAGVSEDDPMFLLCTMGP